MAKPVFIDTDILIDFSRDQPGAVNTIAKLEKEYDFCVSVIVAMELYAGCRSKSDLAGLDSFLSDFTVVHLSETISTQAFSWMRKFRSSHGVEINDMLISATAVSLDVDFISKNQKHYRFLPNLRLLDYPWKGV